MKEKACLVIKGMTEHNYLHTRRRSQSIVKFSICQKKKMEKKNRLITSLMDTMKMKIVLSKVVRN